MNKISLRIDNTLKIKEEAKRIVLPDCPPGNETLVFDIGDSVISTGNGSIKEGVTMTVQDVDLVNGFARYYAGGVWHHQEDLR